MDAIMDIVAWRPIMSQAGPASDMGLLIMVIMSFFGAGVVMRLTQVESSFNFMVNFSVMFIGCLLFREFGSPMLFSFQNDLVASAVTANFGMTLAGFVLLLAYRNSA